MFVAITLISEQEYPCRILNVDNFYDSIIRGNSDPCCIGRKRDITSGEDGAQEKFSGSVCDRGEEADGAVFGARDNFVVLKVALIRGWGCGERRGE